MVELEKVQMTDEELAEKKLHLEFCKINKNESDLILKEMEDTLDKKLAKRLLDDDIAKLERDILEREVRDPWGNIVSATDADVDRMAITLDKFKAQRDLEIPGRQIRLKINQLRDAKGREDAPERQIKKLEKEIREKAYYLTARNRTNPMVG